MKLKNQSANQDLVGKNAIVTGASRGLGAQIAHALWQAGANLLLIAKSEQALLKLQNTLVAEGKGCQRAHVIALDLGQEDSVPVILNQARELWNEVDILVNNAGILGPLGPVWENKPEEWQDTLRINLLVPVRLCQAFVSWMIQRGGGKIINVSGGGATSPRPNFSAYATAKAALVRFSETLAQEVYNCNVQVNCIAPGLLNTDMLQLVRQAGPETVGQTEYLRATRAESTGTSLERAASLCVFLASPAGDGITGKLISAVWDPWESLPEHLEDLKDSDIYALRRIVPQDRGKNWG